jgi:membrane-associated phospholipid phosphatase
VQLAVAFVTIAMLGVFLGRLVVGPLAVWITGDVDTPARSFFEHHESAALTAKADLVTTAGSAWFVGAVVAGVAFACWVRTRRARPAIVLVTAFLGAGVVTALVKYGIHRSPASNPTPRFSPGTFPSGHALFAFTVYGTLAVLLACGKGKGRILRVAAGIVLVALAAAVAFGRVYLLDHYLSDVLGSVVLGAALIAATVRIVGVDRAPH